MGIARHHRLPHHPGPDLTGESMVKLYLPRPPEENVTKEMRNGAFHHDSYTLGRRHAINDCIMYLRQQGYTVAHEGDEAT